MDSNVPFTAQLAVLAVLVGGLFLLTHAFPPVPIENPTATSTQVTAAAAADAAATSSELALSETDTHESPAETEAPVVPSQSPPPTAAPPTNPNQVRRIENPYPTPPYQFETVNGLARAALVNIFCSSNNGLLRPISGSGVMVDPRGVILTNAHVAQYVLLADSGKVNIECAVRAGSPAVPKWRPHVLYLPPVWVDAHAQDLIKEKPFGTGKHDYALLYAGASLDTTPRPALFPYLAPDSREAIGFVDDAVLTASYPAEFLGSIAASYNLYHVTSITRIDELMTLERSSVDVLSLGNVISAQSGSSGGAVANAWARLIGIITTTTDGNTTGERSLRAITLSYINRDIKAQSGKSIADFLAGDIPAQVIDFREAAAPALVDKLLAAIQ